MKIAFGQPFETKSQALKVQARMEKQWPKGTLCLVETDDVFYVAANAQPFHVESEAGPVDDRFNEE